ncbi:MaoC/PaaZ C-terminal domain-containing protein [Microbacterium sp. A82]|uniref:MaoC/PaaZ C-terminal domain-containing protein n=1 Tax=Microbacterium sp. A82 TaxID=3450452 RepID=UPI003F2AAA2C
MTERTLFSRSIGPLSRADIVRYAGAGGDFNPLHHDETFATRAGLGSVIAHGLLTAGLTGTALAEHVGPLRLRRYAVRYTGQVRPGDTLTITASEADGESDETMRIALEVTAAVEDSAARPVLTATAEVGR